MMTYQDTIDWLFGQLPMYQQQGKKAFKKDLSNSLALSMHLGVPEKTFKTVHVAGTNGKGSTAHMLASVLQQAGYRVGLYTSPHLKDFRERIKINGRSVSKRFVVDFVAQNTSFFTTHKISFFEMTVGMAFDYFSKETVDVAVVEVGLGGRLDSTNIIYPLLSVITNIGLDHTAFLGSTHAAIAKEKAGIIKPQTPVVIGETHAETAPVFKAVAAQNHSKIFFADQQIDGTYNSDLKGRYQEKNIKTAVQALKILQIQGFQITREHIQNGLANVVKNTGLQGRWQVLNQIPKVICDTGHNREGLAYVMQQISTNTYDALHIVLGVVKEKDPRDVVDLFPKTAHYYFCKPAIARGMDPHTLKSIWAEHERLGQTYSSVKEAYESALAKASPQDFIFIGGSTFVVAEII